MMKKNWISKFSLIFSISRRFASADRTSRASVTSRLSLLGICFGVMTLIVVTSVMNGFQMSFIDAILETQSYHIQVEEGSGELSGADGAELEQKLSQHCKDSKLLRALTPFYQAQTLMCSVPNPPDFAGGKISSSSSAIFESPAVIRGIPAESYYEDEGFRKEIILLQGSFDLSGRGGIILGNTLAHNLKVRVGDQVNLFVLSGSSDVELFSGQRLLTVKGIFATGYQEINASMCFINLEDAALYFGKDAKKTWGIKVYNTAQVERELRALTKLLEGYGAKISSWKEYNKSFYGALRIEKNMLLLVVCLIFVVVAINIYNAMRRLVFERQREIAILSALGARTKEIQAIFITRGFYTGLLGSAAGLLLGIIISLNTNAVFNGASKIVYFFQYLFTAVFSRENLMYIKENSTYSIYANIPARIFKSEVIMIFIFGIISPLAACFFASKNVLKSTLAEVLHNE
ncbi:ABC transporter permease [Treponema sp. C6A8]|uniref:ABC transporter permease n=1 Tax=Treponema sp. C6A8 TaxID=1410609 RepID=UPI00068734E8|nr:ABC transporter permease [Treponema sp. C6A8]